MNELPAWSDEPLEAPVYEDVPVPADEAAKMPQPPAAPDGGVA